MKNQEAMQIVSEDQVDSLIVQLEVELVLLKEQVPAELVNNKTVSSTLKYWEERYKNEIADKNVTLETEEAFLWETANHELNQACAYALD